jgi:hypothetical protein
VIRNLKFPIVDELLMKPDKLLIYPDVVLECEGVPDIALLPSVLDFARVYDATY